MPCLGRPLLKKGGLKWIDTLEIKQQIKKRWIDRPVVGDAGQVDDGVADRRQEGAPHQQDLLLCSKRGLHNIEYYSDE